MKNKPFSVGDADEHRESNDFSFRVAKEFLMQLYKDDFISLTPNLGEAIGDFSNGKFDCTLKIQDGNKTKTTKIEGECRPGIGNKEVFKYPVKPPLYPFEYGTYTVPHRKGINYNSSWYFLVSRNFPVLCVSKLSNIINFPVIWKRCSNHGPKEPFYNVPVEVGTWFHKPDIWTRFK